MGRIVTAKWLIIYSAPQPRLDASRLAADAVVFPHQFAQHVRTGATQSGQDSRRRSASARTHARNVHKASSCNGSFARSYILVMPRTGFVLYEHYALAIELQSVNYAARKRATGESYRDPEVGVLAVG